MTISEKPLNMTPITELLDVIINDLRMMDRDEGEDTFGQLGDAIQSIALARAEITKKFGEIYIFAIK